MSSLHTGDQVLRSKSEPCVLVARTYEKQPEISEKALPHYCKANRHRHDDHDDDGDDDDDAGGDDDGV